MSRKIVRDIVTQLEAMGDQEKAAHAQRFFKTGKGEYGEGDVFLGIRVPPLRKLARDYRNIAADDAFSLLTSKYHEARLLALLILNVLYDRSNDTSRRHIHRLYLENTRYVNNWDLVDSSARALVGQHLEKRSRKPLYRLAKSRNMWERRIAMIATYHYIHEREYDDALAIALMLLRDDHDLIHKAVGWMLREIGNRDRQVEEEFLKRHCKAMPRTMLRYAIEKFPERTRKRYLKCRA